MKKSIALLLTFSFIIICLSIVGTIFALYKKLTNNNFEYSIAEDSFIIESIQNRFKHIDINSSNDLDKLFFSNMTLKKNNFKIIVLFKSAESKININKVFFKNKINNSMVDFLNLVFDKYNIEDREFFLNLIFDTIDNDKEERSNKTEISLYQPFMNGKIYNYKHLKKIIDYYYNITDDSNIYKIPFKNIFSFNNKYIDCNHLSFTIKSLLGIKSCNDLKILYDISFLNNLGIISFNKNSYDIWINIKYYMYDKEFKMKILYDVIKKKVLKVEKHIIY